MSQFLFLRPGWLLLLPLVPVLLLLARRRGGGGASPWRRVVDPRLLDALLSGPQAPGSLRWRGLLWGSAWSLAVLVLAGPSWQRLPPLEFQPAAPPLSLLVELSPVVEGERLEETRAALRALLERMADRPVSLWVYGNRAWRVMPASADLRLLQRLVDVLSPSLLPAQGQALDAALEQVAADQVRRGAPGEILVVAHGADEKAVARAGELAGRGLRVHVLAPGGESGGLRRLALAGRGGYHGGSRVAALAKDLEPGRYRTAAAAGEPVPVDNGPWLLPLLLGMAFLLFRRGVAPLCLLLLVLPPVPAEAGWKELFFTPDQQAWLALEQGRPHVAAQRFSDPFWRGVALYRAGEYEAAELAFALLDTAPAHYNRGNALVRLGDLGSARAAYLRALELDPGLEDARHNLQLVEEALVRRSTTDPGRRPARPSPEENSGDPQTAQEALEPLREEATAPTPEGEEPEALQASLGGGLLEARDSGAADAGKESGQAGQAPEQGRDRTEGDSGAARSGEVGAAEPKPAEGELLSALPRRANRENAAQPPDAGSPATGDNRDGRAEKETAGEPGFPGSGGSAMEAARAGGTGAETNRAAEVWLESIRDDPAELLRAIFRAQQEEMR